MASRNFSRALRPAFTRQLNIAAPQRTLFSASQFARISLATPIKTATVAGGSQIRGIKTIDFAGTKETVYGEPLLSELGSIWKADSSAEREDWPREKLLVSV